MAKYERVVEQVYPSNTRPHYLGTAGPRKRSLHRVGSTSRKAEALQVEKLEHLNWRTTFDEPRFRT